MLWMLGMVITKLENFCERLKSQYLLHCLKSKGKNCHLDGKSLITAKNVCLGDNVFIGGGGYFYIRKSKYYNRK